MMTAITQRKYSMLADEGIRRFMMESDASIRRTREFHHERSNGHFMTSSIAHFQPPRPVWLEYSRSHHQ